MSPINNRSWHPLRVSSKRESFRTHYLEVGQDISLVDALELQQSQHIQVPMAALRKSAFLPSPFHFPSFGRSETSQPRDGGVQPHTLTTRGLHEPTCRLYCSSPAQPQFGHQSRSQGR